MDNSKLNLFTQFLNLCVDQKQDPQLSEELEMRLATAMNDERDAEAVVSVINKFLITGANRYNGLIVLNNIMDCCPISLLLKNGNTWSNYCVHYSTKEPNTVARFNILVKIMKACRGNQDLHKSLLVLLPKILDLCVLDGITVSMEEAALECLITCFERFPSACGPFKNKLDSFLSKFLESNVPNSVIKKAGKVFVGLQQVGGTGQDGITHRNNWCDQVDKLCFTLHKLYDDLFDGILEFDRKESNGVTFEFEQIQQQQHVTANRFKNVTIFLNSMLIQHFPVAKAVPVETILDVIKRGLIIDIFSEIIYSVKEAEFTVLLYKLQINLFYLLRSLIACVCKDSIPYSFVITKLLVDCLETTRKPYFKTCFKYQKAIYDALNYWLVVVGSKISINLCNKLLSFIVYEVTPVNTNITLCLNENSGKTNTKRAKKRAFEEAMSKSFTNENSLTPTPKAVESKELLCEEALKTGKTLLSHVFLQHNQGIIKTFSQMVIYQLADIQAGKTIHPYNNPKCQSCLYEILGCFLTQPCVCVHPILETAVLIFTRGQRSASDIAVYIACSRGLNILETLCQPICPTLSINAFINDDKLKNKTNTQSYHMKNEDGKIINDLLNSHLANDVLENSNSLKNRNVLDDTTITTPPGQQNNKTLEKEVSPKINIISQQIIKRRSISNVDGNGTTNTENGLRMNPQEPIEIEVEIQEPESNKEDSAAVMIEKTEIKMVTSCVTDENNEVMHENQEDSEMLSSFVDMIN